MSERNEPTPGEYDDSTRPLPPTGPGGSEPADRTQRLPGPADATAAGPPTPADGTAPMDRTAPLPPERSGPPAWSGRAEVPTPRPADYREPADWYPEEQSGPRWWLPILWGVLALLLLALVGGGLWLALRSADDPAVPGISPSPPPSPSATRASPTTGAPATSAAPTTGSPSASPSTTAPDQVAMPPVVNLSLATAQAILDRSDLGHRVEYRTSDRPAGTVLKTDPEAGELVPEGTEVTLVVARGEPTPTGATATPSAEPSPTA